MRRQKPRNSLIASMVLIAGMLALVVALDLQRSRIDRPLVLSGLRAPRGLTVLEDGSLLIAEVLGGQVLHMSPAGDVTVLQSGLPATLGGPGGYYPTGVSAAVMVDGKLYSVVGEFRGRGYSTLYGVGPGGRPRALAGGMGRDGFPETHLTNPYDLVPAPAGGFFVSDAGFNAVLHVDGRGRVADYALLPDRPNPEDPSEAARATMDVVPTGMTYGPDGALYMASLTGMPYPSGAANIYRLEDLNGDGDAADAGEVRPYASGFTAATDLAFLPDGSLLVTEFSHDLAGMGGEFGLTEAAQRPGRLVRWQDGELEVVADGLVSPTAVAVLPGRVFVSEEFAGRVREVARWRLSPSGIRLVRLLPPFR